MENGGMAGVSQPSSGLPSARSNRSSSGLPSARSNRSGLLQPSSVHLTADQLALADDVDRRTAENAEAARQALAALMHGDIEAELAKEAGLRAAEERAAAARADLAALMQADFEAMAEDATGRTPPSARRPPAAAPGEPSGRTPDKATSAERPPPSSGKKSPRSPRKSHSSLSSPPRLFMAHDGNHIAAQIQSGSKCSQSICLLAF